MRRLLAFAVFFALLPAAHAQTTSTTIIVVRHAEAVADGSRDPMLAPEGQVRAQTLAEVLADAGVSAVYATQYRRTQLTGAPTAAAAGVTVTVRPIAGPLEPYVDALVAHVLSTHPGQTVLIVGHSNTAPEVVKGFSGSDPGEIAHEDYGNVYVIMSDGRPGQGRVIRARYGA